MNLDLISHITYGILRPTRCKSLVQKQEKVGTGHLPCEASKQINKNLHFNDTVTGAEIWHSGKGVQEYALHAVDPGQTGVQSLHPKRSPELARANSECSQE